MASVVPDPKPARKKVWGNAGFTLGFTIKKWKKPKYTADSQAHTHNEASLQVCMYYLFSSAALQILGSK